MTPPRADSTPESLEGASAPPADPRTAPGAGAALVALPGENVAVLENRFAFAQATRGWRFGFDAVMLARHVFSGPPGDLLEIGTGCGVVAVLLAGWGWPGRIVAIEVQPALADRARRNVQANGVADQVRVVEGDARLHRDLVPGGTFTRVIANPPYWRLGTGRTNPDPERAAARHEFLLDAPSLFRIVRDRLAHDGVASVLYPPERLPDVRLDAARAGLSVVRSVDLGAKPDAPPEVVILDLAADAPPRTEARSWQWLGRPGAP